MPPNEFLDKLLKSRGLTPTSLAKALHRPEMQGQIHRFIHGDVTEPRAATLEPIAAYLDIPIEALRSEQAATKLASELGLAKVTPPALVRSRPPPPDHLSIQSVVMRLGEFLRPLPERKRRTALQMLDGLVEKPQEAKDIGEELHDFLVSASKRSTG